VSSLDTLSYNGKSIGEVRVKEAENEQLKLHEAKNFFVFQTYKKIGKRKVFLRLKMTKSSTKN